eukprot:2217947-Pleurochrysis_carterae.AAC.4
MQIITRFNLGCARVMCSTRTRVDAVVLQYNSLKLPCCPAAARPNPWQRRPCARATMRASAQRLPRCCPPECLAAPPARARCAQARQVCYAAARRSERQTRSQHAGRHGRPLGLRSPRNLLPWMRRSASECARVPAAAFDVVAAFVVAVAAIVVAPRPPSPFVMPQPPSLPSFHAAVDIVALTGSSASPAAASDALASAASADRCARAAVLGRPPRARRRWLLSSPPPTPTHQPSPAPRRAPRRVPCTAPPPTSSPLPSSLPPPPLTIFTAPPQPCIARSTAYGRVRAQCANLLTAPARQPPCSAAQRRRAHC